MIHDTLRRYVVMSLSHDSEWRIDKNHLQITSENVMIFFGGLNDFNMTKKPYFYSAIKMNKIETRLLKKSVPFRTFPRVLLITKWLIIEYSKQWNFAHQFSIQESQRRKIRREDPARHHLARPKSRNCVRARNSELLEDWFRNSDHVRFRISNLDFFTRANMCMTC